MEATIVQKYQKGDVELAQISVGKICRSMSNRWKV